MVETGMGSGSEAISTCYASSGGCGIPLTFRQWEKEEIQKARKEDLKQINKKNSKNKL
jgi:hypothetical protein